MRYAPPGYRIVGPPPWAALPIVTRVLIAGTALGYLASILSRPVAALLVFLAPNSLLSLELWRLLTFPFVNDSIISTLLFGYLFWVFGPRLERTDGSRRFAVLLILSSLSSAALGSLGAVLEKSSALAAGASGLSLTLLFVWALRSPDEEILAFFVLPLKAKWLAIGLVVIVVFSQLERGFSVSNLLLLLGGAPVAWWWARGISLRRLFGRRGFGGRSRTRRFRVISRDDNGPVN